jgi:hypothetical protein
MGIDRDMFGAIAQSLKGVIVDNRPYREDSGRFPDKRTERWVLGEKTNRNTKDQLFIKEGVYEDVIKEAKEWAQGRKVNKLYLLYIRENAEEDRYNELRKRYEGEGKELNPAELEEFKKLHQKYA